jgi:hypothetical protein
MKLGLTTQGPLFLECNSKMKLGDQLIQTSEQSLKLGDL